MKSNLFQPYFFERRGLWIALAGLLLLPFSVAAGLTALFHNTNEVGDWLPASYSETTDYFWYRRYFENDEFTIVSWEGCTLEDERLDRLREELTTPGRYTDPLGHDRFPQVITGRSALQELLESPNFTREEAIDRLRGALVGPDGQQTCAVASMTDAARQDVHATLADLREATRKAGIPSESLKLGGGAVLNAAIDVTSSRSLNRVVLLTVIVAAIIAWWTIRDLRLIILILITGIYSTALALAVMWLTGQGMNAVLTTMIPMVHVAATSGAIHLCNYYQESVREGGLYGAAGRAVRHAWLPLTLAAATTAAGLLSICFTDLVLIRSFGIYSAIGVGMSWFLLVFWLPAVLTVWKPRNVTLLQPNPEDSGPENETGEAPLPRFWQALGEWVLRRPNLLAALCLLFGAACLPGLFRMNVTIDLLQEFRADAPILRDYEWLEQRLAPLMPLEVIVRIPEDNPLSINQRVELVERLQGRFETLPDVGGSLSPATYVPPVSEGRGPVWLRRGIFNARLKEQRDDLFRTGYLRETEADVELWRISVRVTSLADVNAPVLVSQLRQQVQQELAETPESFRDGIDVVYTGVAPVLYKARQSLVDGLFWGIVTDLILIVVTVTALTRHWSSGLVMACTSLFPTFVILGLVGWTNVRIDLGAIMAPCVALGVTVDDVIHFLLWFRWGSERGMSRPDSVMLAWRACVRPMYQSWSLLGLGMLCLAVSDFIPILQFGGIMVGMLTVGLVGNLVLLPALLAGPLGGVISAHARRHHRPRSLAASPLPTAPGE